MNTETVTWQRGEDGIVVLTFDHADRSSNTFDDDFVASFGRAVARLEREHLEVAGVVLTSGKRSFSGGLDLEELLALQPHEASRLTARLDGLKALLRRLETLGCPVVAALTGSTTGGGLELALAAHHRILLDDLTAVVGFPDVELGLLPGCGGLVRVVRLLGVDLALDRVLLSGRRFDASEAAAIGLVDELVHTPEELLPAAKRWIEATPGALQPWDAPGCPAVGGQSAVAGRPGSGVEAGLRASAPLRLPTAARRRTTAGAPDPARDAIRIAAVEAAEVDLPTAALLETDHLVRLVVGQVAKNRIQAGHFDRLHIRAGGSRPRRVPSERVRRLVVVGAGQVATGVAAAAATRGIDVVLVWGIPLLPHLESARAVERGVRRRLTAAGVGAEALQRIQLTDRLEDCREADLVVEAVGDDLEGKRRALRALDAAVGVHAIFASCTSGVPVASLSRVLEQPEDLVGLHLAQWRDRNVGLVEVITGERTSRQTVARAFDLVQQVGGTPIVIPDRGHRFSEQLLRARRDEALAALAEGVRADHLEQAARQAGYAREAFEAMRRPASTRRPGPSDGGAVQGPSSVDDLPERLLVSEALAAVRALSSGAVASEPDANVGSLLGAGFPEWTGGAVQYVRQHPGGPRGFAARAEVLAERYGSRFAPPPSIRGMASGGVGV